MTSPLPIVWHPREPPLAPVCAIAEAGAAGHLANHLLGRSDADLARLRGAAAPGLLAVLGDSDDLPWVDGVTYLGRDASAPSLLLPTRHAPGLHPALLERALLRRGGPGAPWGVLLDPPRLVPLSSARPLAREALRAWLESAR